MSPASLGIASCWVPSRQATNKGSRKGVPFRQQISAQTWPFGDDLPSQSGASVDWRSEDDTLQNGVGNSESYTQCTPYSVVHYALHYALPDMDSSKLTRRSGLFPSNGP
ncbi:hypothetical protein L209DRAFT_753597 [Thermothelomyces heterothallicus CBS 203.75]